MGGFFFVEIVILPCEWLFTKAYDIPLNAQPPLPPFSSQVEQH